MDVLFIIKSRHVELMQAFERLHESHGIKAKRAAADELALDLQAYLSLEKDILYPEIGEQFSGSETLVSIGMAHAAGIDKRLKALVKLVAKPVDEQAGLDKRIEELRESLVLHFEHEEQFLMPKLRASMRTEDREDLGQLMLEAKEDLAKQVSPEQGSPTRKRA